MKKKDGVLFAAGLVLVSIIVFFSCEKEKKTVLKNQPSVASMQEPSCTTQCKNGSCSAYGNQATCYCNIFGLPRCQGGTAAVNSMPDAEFDGRPYVELNSNILSTMDTLCSLLVSFNKTYASEVADELTGFTSLIETYGYTLNTKDALLAYYTIVDYCEARENFFTVNEVTQMLDLP